MKDKHDNVKLSTGIDLQIVESVRIRCTNIINTDVYIRQADVLKILTNQVSIMHNNCMSLVTDWVYIFVTQIIIE